MECVYWDFHGNRWRNDGCALTREHGDNRTVICECNHLTDFSILMSVVNPVSIQNDATSKDQNKRLLMR